MLVAVFVVVGVEVFGGLPAGGRVAVTVALGVGVSVNVGRDVPVDIDGCVGVDC